MKHFGAVSEPLGIAYLASCLEREKINVDIIDAVAEFKTAVDIIEKIKLEQFSLVGISVLTPSFGVVKKNYAIR